MFEVYEVEWWVLWLYGVSVVLFFLAAAFGWIIASILNKSNGAANERAMKAEANAREAEAGHRECARKLARAQEDAAIWEMEAKKWQAAADYAASKVQKRAKNGRFAPKSGKTGEKKKVSKQLAKPKARK